MRHGLTAYFADVKTKLQQAKYDELLRESHQLAHDTWLPPTAGGYTVRSDGMIWRHYGQHPGASKATDSDITAKIGNAELTKPSLSRRGAEAERRPDMVSLREHQSSCAHPAKQEDMENPDGPDGDDNLQ